MKKRIAAFATIAGVTALLLAGCVGGGNTDAPVPNEPVVDNAIVANIHLEEEDGGKLTFIADRNTVDKELYVGDLTIEFFQNDDEASFGGATSTYSDLAGSVIAVSVFDPEPKEGDKYHIVISGPEQKGFDNKDITFNPEN